jgi:glycosyltransferase involved in cell wall biosynthesis
MVGASMTARRPEADLTLDIVAVFAQAPAAGGGFHQSLNSLETLARACAGVHRLRVTATKGGPAETGEFTRALPFLSDVEWIAADSPASRRFILGVLRRLRLSRLLKFIPTRLWKPNKAKFLDGLGADLVYFLSPNVTALSLSRTPYVMTVWDLCHLDFPEFPEVRADGEFQFRHDFYLRALPQAVMVVTDSEQLSTRAHERYGVDRARLLVQPFQPSPFLAIESPTTAEVLEAYGLEPGYWFYPAQFWPHKNHVRILEALVLLRDRGLVQRAVFAGGDKGFRAVIERHVRRLNVEEQVRFLGFIPSEHLRGLYLAAVGLVFPSYFGPTNLPPLEAIMLGRPVVCSDFHRATLGDQARYFNPDDPFELADAMESVIRRGHDVPEAGEPGHPASSLAGSTSSDDQVEALRDRIAVLSRRLGMLNADVTQAPVSVRE